MLRHHLFITFIILVSSYTTAHSWIPNFIAPPHSSRLNSMDSLAILASSSHHDTLSVNAPMDPEHEDPLLYLEPDIATSNKNENFTSRHILQKQEKIQRKHQAQLRRAENNMHEFKGQHKWLGGGIDPKTGYIYGVPSHASFVLCIQPSTLTSPAQIYKIHLPDQYRHGQFKWLRCIIYNGYMYGIPAWSTHGVLKVRLFETDPSSLNESLAQSRQRVQVLPLPPSIIQEDTDLQHHQQEDEDETTKFRDRRNQPRTSPVDRSRWMWHGGQIGINTHTGRRAIYCPPSNARRVLKICLETDAVTEMGPIFQQGQNKFYGGILGNDGCIYGICYTAQQILRINPCTDEVQLIGPIWKEGGYKWHGGLKAHTGVIYAFPAHANTVLCINTNPTLPPGVVDEGGNSDWRVYTIPIIRGKDDTDSLDLKYKWLGGSYGANGNIFGMPSDANSILRIDPVTDTAITFGHVAGKMNKFQSGVLCPTDNCIYAVAADMDCILRIKTDPNLPVVADTVCGGLGDVDDKFQGGFLANDGKIYSIPENMPYVMVMTPGDEPRVDFIKN